MKELSDLFNYIEFSDLIGSLRKDISSIEYDSRKCTQGSLFVAIKGEQTDGHLFINQAITNGALAVICEILPNDYLNYKTTFILTKNSRKALAKVSNAFFDFPIDKLKVIGVTGTNGKTTVTFIMKSILEDNGFKVGVIGTTGIFFGNEKIEATHTTPESLELFMIFKNLADSNYDFVIMEVSSHALSMQRTYGINFIAALFTNLTLDHLDYHKTMEDYALAKQKLFNNLKINSYAIVNSNDKYSDFMLSNTLAKKIKVGNINSDYLISNSKLGLYETIFELNNKLFKSKLLGNFNIENVALCIACAIELGLDIKLIIDAISTTNGAVGRMQRINLTNGAVGIIDYAHTPDALEKALIATREVLNISNTNGKLISVFGCGGNRDKSKRPIMGRISTEIADITILTSDNPRNEDSKTILDEIETGVQDNKLYFRISDRLDAINKAYELSESGDIILLAGKGHENYQIIGNEKIHFSDIKQMEQFVK